MVGVASAVGALTTLGLLFGALLGLASARFKGDENPLVEQIDALLPQTQCGQCGYPGCRPYAEAINQGDAINKCPPGGDATVVALAELLGREPAPLDGEAPAKIAWPSSAKPSALAAPNAFRPARWMPSSARPNRCTRSSKTNVPAAIYASPLARWTASTCCHGASR